jgi:hypothetical protein
MSNENLTIGQHGGTTRVTHGATPAEQPAPIEHQAARVGNGVTRMNMGEGGEVSQSGVSKYTVGEDRNTSSVMATLERVNGKETVELIPGMPGSRTFIRQALAEGLVEAVGNGQYRDKSASSAEATAEGAPEAAPEDVLVDPGKGVFNPQEDEDWNAAIEPLSQPAYDATAASVTVAVLSGADNLDRAAANLAEQAAIAPELAAMYVREGHDMYERLVAKEASAAGVQDKEGFYGWLRETKGRALHSAIQSLTAGRDVSPFRTLAHEYLRSTSEVAARVRSL